MRADSSAPALVIVNGAAGGGRCWARAKKALAKLKEMGIRFEACQTSAPGHATELARNAFQQGYKQFIAVGGDGTTYEIINGLFPESRGTDKVTLGMLPLGTGNSFLRDFGITKEEEALDAIIRGRSTNVDLIRAKHRDGTLYYINLLGLGFAAEVGALTNTHFKPLGSAGYVAAVMLSLIRLNYSQDAFRVDDEPHMDDRPAILLSFSNSRYTAGTMMMAPNADVSDGKIDIIRIGPLSRLGLVKALPTIFTGTHLEHPQVEQTKAARVEFVHPKEQDVMIDGEVVRLELHAIEVLPNALEIIV